MYQESLRVAMQCPERVVQRIAALTGNARQFPAQPMIADSKCAKTEYRAALIAFQQGKQATSCMPTKGFQNPLGKLSQGFSFGDLSFSDCFGSPSNALR